MWRRGNWRHNFRQRFGKYGGKIKLAVTNRDTIWLHAVSVGEVNICTQLIKALEPRLPNIKLIASTTTSTGMERLEKVLPTRISTVYYPIDFAFAVHRAMRTVHPEAIVLIEAEIWPNFLWYAFHRGIPVFLVNARLSQRSFRGYKLFGFLFRPIFAQFTGVGCQNEADAARLRTLGCRPEAIHIVGNLKFDAAKLDERPLFRVPVMLQQLGVPDDRLLLIGGSTHAGEEVILGRVYQKLKAHFPKLFLIVVPRHFERAAAAGKEVAALGLNVAFRTEVTERTQRAPGSVDCLVVNTTGELKFFYEHADVVFVGKSLTAEGGQSPIEPAALGKPVVFGPNMQNFADISANLVKRSGAFQVQDEAALVYVLEGLLANPALRKQTGRNASDVVNENLGAISKTVEMIIDSFRGTKIFVAEQE